MTTLEQIVEAAHALSSDDKQKLRTALDAQIEARHCTAIHEAAHAVLSYLLGKRVMYVVIFDNWRGEVMPQCSACDTCGHYYKSEDPTDTIHWKRIEDDLRRDIAVALAGEIATTEVCGYESTDRNELRQDRYLSKCRASVIHYRRDKKCLRVAFNETCRACEDYIARTASSVKQIILQPSIRGCVEGFAEQLQQLKNDKRMSEKDVNQFFGKRGLAHGSEFDSLPAWPEDLLI